MHKRDNFDGPSTPQEADSIGPVPSRRLPREVIQGPYEATRIRWRYGLFVKKNHSAVLSLFFRPGFEQRGNRPSIVGNKPPPLHGCLLQAGRVAVLRILPPPISAKQETSSSRLRPRRPSATLGEICSSRRSLSISVPRCSSGGEFDSLRQHAL